MVDGIHVGGHVVLSALGIHAGGDKNVLGVFDGAIETTERTTLSWPTNATNADRAEAIPRPYRDAAAPRIHREAYL